MIARWNSKPNFLYELTQNNEPMNLSEMGIPDMYVKMIQMV